MKSMFKGLRLETVDPDNILLHYNSHSLTAKDLIRIESPNWFNDILINFYISLLKTKEYK